MVISLSRGLPVADLSNPGMGVGFDFKDLGVVLNLEVGLDLCRWFSIMGGDMARGRDLCLDIGLALAWT